MKYLIILSAFALLQSSCKSSKNLSEIEEYKEDVFVMPDLKSTVNVHYRLNKKSLNDTFNVIIDQYLSEDMQLSAMDMDVAVEKNDAAVIEFSDRRVLTKLPIEISVEKNSIFKKLKANGVLDLNFITSFDIDLNWNLETKTTLEHYEWLREPNLSLGVFKIPVGSLANGIIEKSKADFEKQIDKSINDQLSVRDKVLELVKYIEEPIQVDTLLNSWVSIMPEYVYMSEIINSEDWSEGNITVQGKTKITEEKLENNPTLNLPEFLWEKELDKDSRINFVLDISFDKVNEYLNENYRGKSFSADGKSITINNIVLSRKGDKLLTIADVTGSVNGEIHISGKPIFDNEKQAFYADNIDVDLKTKNVLHKAGAWLLKGKVKNQLKDLLSFSVKDNIATVQEQLDLQIEKYRVEDQLDINAELKEMNISKFVLGNEKIHAFVTLILDLEAVIYDMRVFSNPQEVPPFKR